MNTNTKQLLAVFSLMLGLSWGIPYVVSEEKNSSWLMLSIIFLGLALLLWFWISREQRSSEEAARDSLDAAEDNLKKLEAKADAQSAPTSANDSVPVTDATEISGQTYIVDTNEFMLETITLNFATSGCEIHLKIAEEQDVILCGYGAWQRSDTTLFNNTLLLDRVSVATSGSWTSHDTFTVIFRLYETPFYYTMVCHFSNEEMLIEMQVNVSLESMESLVVTAQQI